MLIEKYNKAKTLLDEISDLKRSINIIDAIYNLDGENKFKLYNTASRVAEGTVSTTFIAEYESEEEFRLLFDVLKESRQEKLQILQEKFKAL